MTTHRYRVTRTLTTTVTFTDDDCAEFDETPEQYARMTAEDVQGRATDDEIDALLGGIFEFADRRRILLRPDWLPGPTRPEATR